jgi:hypothetical protein
MPYIAQQRRRELDAQFGALYEGFAPLSNGERNYVLTRMVHAVWAKVPSYAVGQDIVGLLACVSQEFYRRVLAIYEDNKVDENGDVMPFAEFAAVVDPRVPTLIVADAAPCCEHGPEKHGVGGCFARVKSSRIKVPGESGDCYCECMKEPS